MREMKDSKVPWIGRIPANWEVAPLWRTLRRRSEDNHPNEVVLSLYRDLGIIPKDSRDDNHNVTSLDTTNYKFVRKGDFVINKMKAWQGSMAVSGYQGIVSPAYHVCEFINNSVFPHYLHYLLRNSSYLPEYDRLSTGLRVGQWDLSYDDFKNIPHLIPPYEEQLLIADFLDRKCADIDNVLEKTKASIEEYKKLKQSVITEAVTNGIRKGRPMKDSGVEWIGHIPDDWTRVKIGQLFDYIGGNAFDSASFNSEGYGQVLRIGNIKNDKIDLKSSPVFVSKEIADSAEKVRVREGYILFTMTGTKGKGDYFYTVYVSSNDVKDNPIYINQRVGAFRAKDGVLSSYYNYLFKVEKIRNRIFLYETGTANQGNLGIESICRVLVQVPSFDEQQEIASYLYQKCSIIDSLIENKEKLITELELYKRSLIYEYVTGKKEVSA